MDDHQTFKVTQDRLEALPEPVQRYMQFSGVLKKPWIHSVRLAQTGRFRMAEDRPWMPMRATQTYTTAPVSFRWEARFKLFGLPLLHALDQYMESHGQMHGKLFGLYTLFNVRGAELDQGSLMRYMSEMIWFPIAFLGKNISWEAVDEGCVKVTLTEGARSVTGKLYFDDQGRPINFRAKRYREDQGQYSLDTWSTPITGYAERAGLMLPVSGQAIWHLDSGPFTYIEIEVGYVEYNEGRDQS